MIPAMPATAASSHRRRGHSRKGSAKGAGPARSSASGTALRFGRLVAMGAVAVLILLAGVWGSWGPRST